MTLEAGTLESLLATFFLNVIPPPTLSEAIVDHDYSLVAAKRFGDAAKDSWIANVAELKKLDTNMIEPLRQFTQTELRSFKDYRRSLEQTQKSFDHLHQKYSAQAKTREPSTLQQVAFQLHDARKAYLKASLDFAVALPQLKLAFDKLLARVFSDQMCTMQASRDATSIILAKYASDVGRIRSWSKEIESGEKAFRRELHSARIQIEEAAELASRPSREVEDYAIVSTSIKGPTNSLPAKPSVTANGKQGWLNMKLVTGKPARTIWIRRWFFVKNGVFGWLVQGMRSGGVEESDRIGVLLCGLRPAISEERRFCFEVKTKDITIVLQADSQSELTEWMVAFDVAKQKALEDPTSTATETLTSQPLDLAFAISPPSSLEFTANSADVGLTSDDFHDRTVSGSLTVPQDPTSPTHRGSFDVSAVRRTSGFDADSNTQTGRGTRKSSGVSQVGSLGGNPPGGIASLISAGNMALPMGAGAAFQAVSAEGNRSFTNPITKMPLNSVIRSLPKSTLAPSTLVNPPVSTNLSSAAVVLNGEKGNIPAQMDLVKGTPSGMMANSWGSLNWAYNNSLSRSDLPIPGNEDPNPAKSGPNSPEKKPLSSIGRDQNIAMARGHRKTVSLDGDAADLQRTIITPGTFPNYYPTLLKYHDAQFRVLFPSVPRDEKLVMVFRATWNPSDHGDFPGRIYVTPQTVYSYSNHMGLILTSSLSLHHVAEVTAATGRECDYLFIHLKPSSNIDYTRITVKVFLEPLKLLEKRLSYLVSNANSSNPNELETVMSTMLKFEQPEPGGGRSPSIDSTDEQDGATIPTRGAQLNGKDLRTRLRIDQDILGLGNFDNKEKLRLPSRPVNYVPNGMTSPVVDMNFKISPKALFHILYGDRSVIWQLLYHQCGARNIQQGPWLKPEEGYYRRVFSYRIPAGKTTGLAQDLEAEDTQTLDVFSDHLCYMVTERRSAWYLPMNKQFELVIKVVITHIAKSNCKLAVYTDVHWIKSSILKPLIDHHALAALKLDALDLIDVVTEQVNRIGHHVQSKKAIQIFGQIGQEFQTVEFKGADSTAIPRTRHVSQRKSIARLFLDAYGSFIAGCVNIVLAQVIAIFDWVVKTFNANFWLVLFFTLSLLVNAFFSSGLAISWWQDLQAGQYMRTLGISNDLVITRVINLSDMDLITSPSDRLHEDNLCYQTFKKSSSFTSSSAASPAFSRLRNTQRVLGTYRHDLIVALRMVNSMEQGMIQAEWEYWLDEEIEKCSTAAKVLAKGMNDSSASDSGMYASHNETVQRVRRYCGSCEESRKVIRKL